MKIDVDRKNFTNLFILATSGMNLSRTFQQNVLVEAKDGKVTVCGTIFEFAVRSVIGTDVNIQDEGKVLLPCELVKKILTATSNKRICLETSDTIVKIYGDQFSYQLMTSDPNAYPCKEIEPTGPEVVLPTGSLQRMIRRTRKFVELDNARYSIFGVMFEAMSSGICAVSTDGRRLSVQKEQIDCNLEANVSAILPVGTLGIIESYAPKTGDIRINFNESEVFFSWVDESQNEIFIRSSVIQGRYPRWKSIIPENFDDFVTVPVISEILATAVRQTQIVTNIKDPAVRFHGEGYRLQLSSQVNEVGNATVEIPVEDTGSGFALKLDPRFLLEYLGVLEKESLVNIYAKTGDKFCMTTDNGGTYVIMPLADK